MLGKLGKWFDKIEYKHFRGLIYTLVGLLAFWTAFYSSDLVDFISRMLIVFLAFLLSIQSFKGQF